MSFSFIKLLKKQLLLPLPGAAAQSQMAPYQRRIYDPGDIAPLNHRRGSVLILLYPEKERFSIVYIRRAKYKGIHSGQVSFPGGEYEDTDITFETTALREAQEEIGIQPEEVKLLGKLTDLYIPPSNFLVSAFVGFIPFRPAFDINENEVAALIEVKLGNLLQASGNIATQQIRTGSGIAVTAPFYHVEGHQVWGATAMITSEFIEVLRQVDKVIPIP